MPISAGFIAQLGIAVLNGVVRAICFDRKVAGQLSANAQDVAIRLEQRLRYEVRTDFEATVARVANWQMVDHAAAGGSGATGGTRLRPG